MSDKKASVILEALKDIEKKFGKGSIIKMWDNTNAASVNTFHSGSYILDLALGGGYPEGRVVEVYGPESSGKTTITLLAAAEVQKKWETVAFIDAEHAFDPNYARMLGVDVDNLYFSQPDYGEQALSIAEELAKTGAFRLIIIDSVAALTPRAEIEGDMWDSHMGLQARMMSQWLRKLTGTLAKTGTTVIFINQIRMKIGVMFGNPETTTWGNALKFYASQRLEIRRGEKMEENKELVGYVCKAKIIKNKISPPFKLAEIPIRFRQWVDHTADVLDAAVILWLVTKAGAFYTLWTQKHQGKEKCVAALTQDPKLQAQIEKEIQIKMTDIRKGKNVIPAQQLEAMSIDPVIEDDDVE